MCRDFFVCFGSDGWGYYIVEADYDGLVEVLESFIKSLLKKQRAELWKRYVDEVGICEENDGCVECDIVREILSPEPVIETNKEK